MTILRILIFAAGAALVISIVWAMGADGRSFAAIITEMLAEPWSVVTLIDLYVGFVLCAMIMVLFEKTWPARLFWAAPLFLFGNFWAAAWLILRLPEIASVLKRARRLP